MGVIRVRLVPNRKQMAVHSLGHGENGARG